MIPMILLIGSPFLLDYLLILGVFHFFNMCFMYLGIHIMRYDILNTLCFSKTLFVVNDINNYFLKYTIKK